MDPLLNPATIRTMLDEPEFPVQRTDFIHTTAPSINTNCRMLYPGNLAADAPAQATSLYPSRRSLAETTAASLSTLALSNHPSAAAAYAAWMSAQISHSLPSPSLIFTHGRNTGLDDESIVPFLKSFARTRPVLGFEDFGNENARAATSRSLLNHFPSTTALGGRSKGARASCRAQIYTKATQLIFFTYPLFRGTDERYDELLSLEPDTDVLFIIGDSDPLAVEMHLRGIRERMRDRGVSSWWVKVVGGNHNMLFTPPERRDAVCSIVGQISARWMDERDPERTELVVGWDKKRNVPTFSGWTPYVPGPKVPTRFCVSIRNRAMPGGGGDFSFELP